MKKKAEDKPRAWAGRGSKIVHERKEGDMHCKAGTRNDVPSGLQRKSDTLCRAGSWTDFISDEVMQLCLIQGRDTDWCPCWCHGPTVSSVGQGGGKKDDLARIKGRRRLDTGGLDCSLQSLLFVLWLGCGLWGHPSASGLGLVEEVDPLASGFGRAGEVSLLASGLSCALQSPLIVSGHMDPVDTQATVKPFPK